MNHKNRACFVLLCYLFIATGCKQKDSKLNIADNSNIEKRSASSTSQSSFENKLAVKMSEYNIPGVSISIIENGNITSTKCFGHLQAGKAKQVNNETIFSVGSISKVGTALIVLKLVETGLVNLDTDINNYISSWTLRSTSNRLKGKVTLRHILSHTAGLNVYGFADYQPNEKLPTTKQILEGTYPAKNSAVRVTSPIGKDYEYSGGGTTILQLLVEEITKTSFNKAADSILFKPLGLKRSSYLNPLPESFDNIAKAHNNKGKPRALPRGYESMPEAAASGLWTTPQDITKLMLAIMNSNKNVENSFLSQKLAIQMTTAVPPSPHGLGPETKGNGKQKLFLHGGSNDSYKARFVGNLYYENGYAICVNGANGNEFIMDVEKLIFEEMDWNESLISNT